MTISFSFPLSDILGRVRVDDLDTDGALCVGAGAARRDDEATGCLAVVADGVLIVAELAVGLEEVDMVGTVDLVLEPLTVGGPVVGGLELDGPLVDGFSVEVVVRGLTAVVLDVRGFKSSVAAAVVVLEIFEIDSEGREVPTALEVVLRDVVAAVLLSGAVDEVWAVDVSFVEVVVLRDDTAGSATSETAVVRTAVFRAVVVVDVGAGGALTVVRLGAGTVFLI
jgi:hypothetical protein